MEALGSSETSGTTNLATECHFPFMYTEKGTLPLIATRFGPDGPGIESGWGARFSAPVQTGPGAPPASCTMGIRSFPGVKRPGRGVDHPPRLALGIKKE